MRLMIRLTSAAVVVMLGFAGLLLTAPSASAASGYPPPVVAATSCSVAQAVAVGNTFTFNATCTFAPGSTITVTLNGVFYETLTAPSSGVFTETIVVTDPHISLNGGPAEAAAYGATETFVATGTNASGASNTSTAIITIPSAASSSGLAFTGADLAATMIGGATLLLMGIAATTYARRRARHLGQPIRPA
jgi:hypothetical protein